MSAGICKDCRRAVEAHHPNYLAQVKQLTEGQGETKAEVRAKLEAVEEWATKLPHERDYSDGWDGERCLSACRRCGLDASLGGSR